jgi:DnaJ-like protein
MDKFALIAERKIREAMEQGAFDRLEGEGRPIALSENPFEDASLRMGHRLLRNNGFAPAWIEESKDIDAQRQILESDAARIRARNEAGADREWFDRKMQDIRDRTAALNRRIADFNLKAPTASVQKPLV